MCSVRMGKVQIRIRWANWILVENERSPDDQTWFPPPPYLQGGCLFFPSLRAGFLASPFSATLFYFLPGRAKARL
ncbi:hypothetical protein CEP54_015620 [Fusarium duplospermum]|uniref:Uncharacterized protein n=1 Tax=Fusarium duplospermum TaxID=1325734 RepID=A0A428NMP9_9HYPO|nr:hypothetical protein CEP54_015620 [Fusarium duplospermum]